MTHVTWLRAVGFGVAYFAGSELGRVFSITPADFSTLWPPSGLYLAALLLVEVPAWPRLITVAAVASVASDMLHGQSAAASVVVWAGDTLQAVLGAWVLRRLFPAPFTVGRLRSTIGFACVCAVASALGAVVSGAVTARTAVAASLALSWWTWWTADLIGMMIFTPLVLAFAERPTFRVKAISPWRMIEAALYVAGTAAMATAVFEFLLPHLPVKFLLYPFLLWGVLRFGLRGAACGLAVVTVVAAYIAFHRTPVAGPGLAPLQDVLLNQLFLVITALSFLSLAAVIHERDDSARKLTELIEAMPTFAWTALPGGALDFVSRHARQYAGLSVEAASGPGWQAIVHAEDLGSHAGGWRAAVSSGEPLEMEARFRRAADGEYRWFLTRAVPLRDERGAIVKWYGVSTDIDDRKRAEALLEGEKRVLEMVARGDSLAHILEELCRLVEEQADDALASIMLVRGDRLRHGAAPTLPPAYTAAIEGVRVGPGTGSCGAAAYHGRRVIVEDIATDPLWADTREFAIPHGLRACWSTPIFSSERNVIATFALYYREPRTPSARDQQIVERTTYLAGVGIQRRLDEEKLRESAELLSLAHDAVIVLDRDRRITFWNTGAEQTYGWPAEDALGRIVHELLQTRFPVSREAVDAAFERGDEWVGEVTHIRRDGTAIVVASRQSVRRDERGVTAAILEINRDVTETRQAEYLIQQVFDNAPDSIAVIGRDYRYRRVNPVFERIVGLAAEQIVGVPVAQIVGSEHFEQQMKADLDRCFAGEPVYVAEWFTHLPGRRYLSVSYSPLRRGADRVEAALVIARDLTDHMLAVESLEKVQAELAHVTRVTMLGELAASIAHEVNQPLAAIVADATACQNWLAKPDPPLALVRETLEALTADGHRAAEVIQRIRQFATKSAPAWVPLDVNDIVRDVVPLVRAEARRHAVSITLELAPTLPPVRGDRVQLQQVLLNLAINAIEAMARVDGRARALVIRSEVDDAGFVIIAVQDTGSGVHPEVADQLFDAFVTTKPGGLGMGLSISRSIIEAHGGRVWFSAAEPHGAIFHVALPAGA